MPPLALSSAPPAPPSRPSLRISLWLQAARVHFRRQAALDTQAMSSDIVIDRTGPALLAASLSAAVLVNLAAALWREWRVEAPFQMPVYES